jgi:PleD family two-component response regulator
MVNSLSVSCGYVTKNEVDITSIHEIANLADKKMYKAKTEFYRNNANEGRGRFVKHRRREL